jgi:alpha-tubulin suppressor-like RCC1 family protein
VNLVPAESARIAVTLLTAAGDTVTDGPVEWTSSDTTIARVNSTGLVTAVDAGSAWITATVEHRPGSARVIVVGERVAEEAVVLDTTSAVLVSDSDEVAGGVYKFLFSITPPSIDSGDVIVGGHGGGILRKVIGVAIHADTIVLSTVQGHLTDVIDAGRLEFSVRLEPAGVARQIGQTWIGPATVQYAAPGVTVTAGGISLDNVVLINEDICSDDESNCASVRLALESGSIDFSPDFDLQADFGFPRLIKELSAIAAGTLELDVEARLAATGSFSKASSFPLLTTLSWPFTFPGPGSLPIWGEVQLGFVVGYDVAAETAGNLETGIRGTHSMQLGGVYDGDEWATVFESHSAVKASETEWEAAGAADVHLFVRPEIVVFLYTVPGGFIGLEPYLRFAGSADQQEWSYRLMGGVDGVLGLRLKIFHVQIAELSTRVAGPALEVAGDQGVSTGSMRVVTATTGDNLDSDGYSVRIDDGADIAIGVNDTLLVTGLAVGDHTVELMDVATNCDTRRIVGNPQTARVPAADTVVVTFDVTCTGQTADLEVRTSTTGFDLDPDGYVITLSMLGALPPPFGGVPIGIDGVVTFEGLPAGNDVWHLVELSNVADNCSVVGGNSRTITLEVGALGVVTFAVQCRAAGAWVGITAGEMHTCAIRDTGKAYCWGWDRDGQLGDGRTTTEEQTTPVAVSGSLDFEWVSAGEGGNFASGHTCGVTSSGAAYCWGGGEYGQLGDGSTSETRATPVAVSDGLSFASVSAGRLHTCGVASDGRAYCWGRGSLGQLGNAATPLEQSTPVAVVGEMTFSSVSAGGEHTCGVTVNGAAYCWGSGGGGKCGDGNRTPSNETPVAVSGGHTFASVTASRFHSCGVTTGGTGYCWGPGGEPLGSGSTDDQTTPVAVSGGLTFDLITAGHSHTCGLTNAGVAYCWGRNINGQLGDGTTESHGTPVSVSGGITFTSLAAGGYHTCGISDEGTVYCWGWNVEGQVGDGSTMDRYVPVRVLEPQD